MTRVEVGFAEHPLEIVLVHRRVSCLDELLLFDFFLQITHILVYLDGLHGLLEQKSLLARFGYESLLLLLLLGDLLGCGLRLRLDGSILSEFILAYSQVSKLLPFHIIRLLFAA